VAILIVIAVVVKYVADVSAARREAERQRRQAEELVSFIVGDLHTKLESVGRLDALDAAAQRALAYFASLRAEDLDGNDLHRHALALAQLGQVRVDEGKLDDAVKLFSESLRFASEAVSRDAKREEWQLALSNAHFWLGESLRRRGDHRGALTHFRTYLDISQRLTTAHPGVDRYEAELGYGHANVGAAYEAAGDITSALREYRTSVAVARHRVARGPQYVQRHEDLAASLNLAGAALQSQGDLAAARSVFDEELAERRKLVAAAPNDAPRIQRLATALAYMGQLHKTLNDPERAAAAYREELELATRLTRLDPANFSAQRNAAVAESRLAELTTGNPAEGLAMIEHAIAALRRVSAADSRPAWRRDLAVAYRREAALQTLTGNARLARQATLHALDTIESVARDDPENPQTQRVLQEVRALAAHIPR
jgi:tetratricopeptide (TPR) repeat protein